MGLVEEGGVGSEVGLDLFERPPPAKRFTRSGIRHPFTGPLMWPDCVSFWDHIALAFGAFTPSASPGTAFETHVKQLTNYSFPRHKTHQNPPILASP